MANWWVLERVLADHPQRAALLWALLILVLCLMPGQALPAWQWADLVSLDKWVHATLFCVLMVLTVRAFIAQYASSALRSHPIAAALALVVAYGALLELMQELPALGRRGDLPDLVANTLGALVGLIYLRGRMVRERSAVNGKG